MPRLLLSTVAVTLLATVATGQAQGEAPQPPPGPPPGPPPAPAPTAFEPLAVTWSPLHLVLPVLELTLEYVVAPHVGIAVVGGAGRVSNATDTVHATVYEVGGQLNYYFMQPASGLHAGAEAVYLHAGDVAQDLSINAAGLVVGPYAGYKLVAGNGFTFVAQLGIEFAAFKAESSTQMANDKKVFPLLNLNVGWSF